MSLLLDGKLAAARAVGAVVRRAGRGGTSLPGKMLVRLDRGAIAALAGRLERGSVVISATNGKTTTATMAAAVLARAGVPLVHNRAGANMAGGIASALVSAARRSGAMSGELGLFELDEFWLDRVGPDLAPKAIVLGNLFRDQLDRYGELETIADRWATAVSGPLAGSALILNADDPLIADLGRDREQVRYFGIQDDSLALPEMQHAADSKHCRRCGAAYIYEAIYLGHLGRYRCVNCGRQRPDPQVSATRVELHGTRSAGFELHTADGSATVKLPLPGLYNVYNALAAATVCLALGIPLETVVEGLERVSAAFGRAELVTIGRQQARILLVKNPAGANEILRTVALEPAALELLAILNDRTADGRDISWVWDADFELLSGRAGHVTCAGTRAAEMALRLKYAGLDVTQLTVLPDVGNALDHALSRLDEQDELFVLPTYTALLELKAELARRGYSERFWEELT